MIENLEKIVSAGNVFAGRNLKEYTTFKVGGPAKAVVNVGTKEELRVLTSFLNSENIPYFVIGNGSNLLVSDEGYEGVVIKLTGEFLSLSSLGESITAGAGVILSKVCNLALEKSLTGLEFAYGIPGTVGGAMVMNAGAYDGEMSYVVDSVEMLSKAGEVVTFSCKDMCFGYRDSVLKHESFIVLSACFSLKKGNEAEIRAKMNDFMERRRAKQPLEFPSAGSTFKRPEGYFAGKLIMEAGLAGKRVGGASVSEKHCGFVINDNNGTASDIDELMKEITDTVKGKFGVTLEPEVIRIGHFN